MFIFWERETELEQGRGRERGRCRIWHRLQALSCQHRAWSRAQTHIPGDNDMSGTQTLNRLSHPGAPNLSLLLINIRVQILWTWCASLLLCTSKPLWAALLGFLFLHPLNIRVEKNLREGLTGGFRCSSQSKEIWETWDVWRVQTRLEAVSPFQRENSTFVVRFSLQCGISVENVTEKPLLLSFQR